MSASWLNFSGLFSCLLRTTSVAVGIAALSACAVSPAPRDASANAASAWQQSRQMLVVTSTDWDSASGQLQRYQRSSADAPWQAVGAAVPVVLGRSGAAWGIGLHPAQNHGPQKREGDGKAPAGVFDVGVAFGYAANARTGLRYQPMQAQDWCVDVTGSPLYNQIVSTRTVGDAAVQGASEPMRRDIHKDGDGLYQLGFVIAHNPHNVDAMGSCIFAHVWDSPHSPTAGCTAMEQPAITEVLAWLDADAKPVFVLLPQAQYRRLQNAWQLPQHHHEG